MKNLVLVVAILLASCDGRRGNENRDGAQAVPTAAEKPAAEPPRVQGPSNCARCDRCGQLCGDECFRIPHVLGDEKATTQLFAEFRRGLKAQDRKKFTNPETQLRAACAAHCMRKLEH